MTNKIRRHRHGADSPRNACPPNSEVRYRWLVGTLTDNVPYKFNRTIQKLNPDNQLFVRANLLSGKLIFEINLLF